MAATIIQRTGMVAQRATYVTNWGYAYCTTCYSVYRPPHTERDTSLVDNAPCDRCGKSLNESIEIVDAAYIVEAVSCKIF